MWAIELDRFALGNPEWRGVQGMYCSERVQATLDNNGLRAIHLQKDGAHI